MKSIVFSLLFGLGIISFSQNILRVKATSLDYSTEAILRLHPSATADFDSQLDARFMDAGQPLCLFSLSEDSKKLTINSVNDEMYNIIPLVIDHSGNADSLHLDFTGSNTFDENTEVYLEDHFTGEVFDLKADRSIIIDTNASKERLQIVMYKSALITSLEFYTENTTEIDQEDKEEVVFKGMGDHCEINVNMDFSTAEITIVNMMGDIQTTFITIESEINIANDILNDGVSLVYVKIAEADHSYSFKHYKE